MKKRKKKRAAWWEIVRDRQKQKWNRPMRVVKQTSRERGKQGGREEDRTEGRKERRMEERRSERAKSERRIHFIKHHKLSKQNPENGHLYISKQPKKAVTNPTVSIRNRGDDLAYFLKYEEYKAHGDTGWWLPRPGHVVQMNVTT